MKRGNVLKKGLIGFVLLIVVLLGALGFRTIAPSQIGVVVRFGNIVSVEESGITWQVPFVTRITKMDVNQRSIIGVYETSTKDMQTTTEYVTTQYVVDASKAKELYKSFLGNHEVNIIQPIIASVVQDSVSTVSISELVSNRVELSNTMTAKAKELLEPYGIRIVSMQITNHDFSDEYETAITAKIVAQERVKTAQYEQETAKVNAETNKIMSQSYDENVKFKMFLEKWNGILPLYVTGESEMMNMLLPTMDTVK